VGRRTRYTRATLKRQDIKRQEKRKLAQARMQYATIHRRRVARKMNKAEDKAMSSRPSIVRIIGAAVACLIIAVFAIRHEGTVAATQTSSLEQRNQAIVHVVALHHTKSLVGVSSRLLSLQGLSEVELVGSATSCATLRQLSPTLTNPDGRRLPLRPSDRYLRPTELTSDHSRVGRSAE
jgi:hypothetical protein